jgi:hypothetical protein
MVDKEEEGFYSDMKVLEIYETACEINKNTLARYLLQK